MEMLAGPRRNCFSCGAMRGIVSAGVCWLLAHGVASPADAGAGSKGLRCRVWVCRVRRTKASGKMDCVHLPTKTPRESKRSLQSCTSCNVVTAQAIRQSAIVSLPFPPYTRRPQQSRMSLRRGVLALALPVLAMVLAGCGCERDGMITCVVDKTSQSHEICGVTAYSKVMSGDTTVADCCVALKAVQDCYAVCSCDTECADEDKALACPTTGKVSDPIRFWELILAGLNKDGETCATAGVTGTQC